MRPRRSSMRPAIPQAPRGNPTDPGIPASYRRVDSAFRWWYSCTMRCARLVSLLVGAAGALIGLGAAPPLAAAATTIGSVSGSYGSGFSPSLDGGVALQYADPFGPTFQVPTGGGVVTSVSTIADGTSLVMLIRPSTRVIVGQQAVVGHGTTGAAGSASARIPVQAGDRLGIYLDNGHSVAEGNSGNGGQIRGYNATAGAPGTGTPLPDTANASTLGDMAIAATVEPDADHDGYGDETQDACPGTAALHVAPCTVDLAVSASARPATITAGEVSTISIPVTLKDGAAATGTSATLTIPASLQLLALTSTGGACTGSVCPLGTITQSSPGLIQLVVRGAGAGSQSVGVSLKATEPVTKPGDDSATATLLVNAAASPAPTPTPTPSAGGSNQSAATTAIKLCTVPKLKGKTKAATQTLLKKAGCATGKLTGSKRKKARVKTQTIPAGTKVLAGTKVGAKLG